MQRLQQFNLTSTQTSPVTSSPPTHCKFTAACQAAALCSATCSSDNPAHRSPGNAAAPPSPLLKLKCELVRILRVFALGAASNWLPEALRSRTSMAARQHYKRPQSNAKQQQNAARAHWPAALCARLSSSATAGLHILRSRRDDGAGTGVHHGAQSALHRGQQRASCILCTAVPGRFDWLPCGRSPVLCCHTMSSPARRQCGGVKRSRCMASHAWQEHARTHMRANIANTGRAD
jgi:hypothetical protein